LIAEAVTDEAATDHGLTFLEVIVVLAVLATLAWLLAPVVFRYVDDSDERQAIADVNTIADAIRAMHRDTHRWPFYRDGDGPEQRSPVDAEILTSNAACRDDECRDTTLPADATDGETWVLTTGMMDAIANHLVTNTPFGSTDEGMRYATDGNRAWRGPYGRPLPRLDPWGNSYVVNIRQASPLGPAQGDRKILVASGGPDGRLQTRADVEAGRDGDAAGDVVIARVR
jgi:prepilin-type N-terminal cleavage/methylation domain-containing protein